MYDIVRELREYGITPYITDPVADAEEAKRIYGITFADPSEIVGMDAVILAVAHTPYARMSMEEVGRMFGEGQKVLVDVKGILDRRQYEAAGYRYWRL